MLTAVDWPIPNKWEMVLNSTFVASLHMHIATRWSTGTGFLNEVVCLWRCGCRLLHSCKNDVLLILKLAFNSQSVQLLRTCCHHTADLCRIHMVLQQNGELLLTVYSLCIHNYLTVFLSGIKKTTNYYSSAYITVMCPVENRCLNTRMQLILTSKLY